MDVAESKRILRRKALGRRGRLTPEDREQLGARIAERILDLDEVAGAQTVLAYASFGAEVPTDGLIQVLLARGVTVLLPAVDGDRLRAHPVASLEEVAPGYRGIREPVRRETVPPAADVVLVPGVAFDSTGRRLGYGGGFYDRYLAEARGRRVGVCFEAQVVAEVPTGAGDVPVEVVVTEDRVIRTVSGPDPTLR
jgi:5-formyltetrahydrofolate cyclo-ligase